MTKEPIDQALFEGQGRFIELPEGLIKMMTEQQTTKTNAELYGEGGVAVLPEAVAVKVIVDPSTFEEQLIAMKDGAAEELTEEELLRQALNLSTADNVRLEEQLAEALASLEEAHATIATLREEMRVAKNTAELNVSTLHARVKILELDNEALQTRSTEAEAGLMKASLDDGGAERLRGILRYLLTLKWHKDTFGKTPEYLERQKEAWALAMEAAHG